MPRRTLRCIKVHMYTFIGADNISYLRPTFRHCVCLQIVMINPSQLLTEANNNACTMLIKMTTPAGEGMAKTKAIIPLPSLRDCSVRT